MPLPLLLLPLLPLPLLLLLLLLQGPAAMPRLVSAAALAALAAAAPQRTTINNTAPRLDINGEIMDAHDLSLRRLPSGEYVMHAASYGLCVAPARMGCDQTPDHCGFRNNHNVTVWTSPSLASGTWTPHGNAFEVAAREVGILYRPDAIFAPATGNWVLWYNLAGSAGNIYATSVSPSPFGPFTDHQKTDAFVNEGGDFHLFSDAASGENYLVCVCAPRAPAPFTTRTRSRCPLCALRAARARPVPVGDLRAPPYMPGSPPRMPVRALL